MYLKNQREAGVAGGMSKGRMTRGKFPKVGRRWAWGEEPDRGDLISMM